MTELQTETNNKIPNEDIDSKIADFMADIDEIVLGKKTNDSDDKSEWKECFDETSQAIYYWNTNTNECSWDPPSLTSIDSTNVDGIIKKKRQQSTTDNKSPKKIKKPSLIAEYASSASEEDDDIDELLNEVLDKEVKVDEKVPHVHLYSSFEEDYRALITHLIDLSDKTTEMFTLQIQLETRLEDCLTGHLSKSYAVSKLEQARIQIEEFEKSQPPSPPIPVVTELLQQPLTSSEMALLLSLPPPPPPPSDEDDTALQLFYAQLNYEESEATSSLSEVEKTPMITKSEHHHHHHKDKKPKPAKTLPTDLIQKWAHARQELHGSGDMDDS